MTRIIQEKIQQDVCTVAEVELWHYVTFYSGGRWWVLITLPDGGDEKYGFVKAYTRLVSGKRPYTPDKMYLSETFNGAIVKALNDEQAVHTFNSLERLAQLWQQMSEG